MFAAKKYYICTMASKSGIARYAEDFFRIILKPIGFEHLSPEHINKTWIMSAPADTVFHLELGAGQFAERDALICLTDNNFKNIDITVHDPPWLTFPFYRSGNRLLDNVSKAFDWYFNTAGACSRVLRRCRTVYVLSQRGKFLLEERHRLENVRYIPFVIDQDKIWSKPLENGCSDIIYFGFIGPNKGLDYALAVHAEIRSHYPDIRMSVVGEPAQSSAQSYFDNLKTKYQDGVSYLGFINESDLDSVFSRVGHVFLPIRDYRYYCPFSASIFAALCRGRIVWTNPVNAINELIKDDINGRYFTGDMSKDAAKFIDMISRHGDMERLSLAAINTCRDLQEKLKIWADKSIDA